jgi:hypothetical protein
MSILDLFCSVDDFWQWFAPQWGPAPASASSTRPRWPPGNRDDRRPVPQLLRRVRQRVGKLFADRGYISQPLAEQLLVEHGVQLITKLRKNMHNRLLDPSDKLLLRKRAIIETINDQLKNICQIEHPRHRSPVNFLVNLVAGLIAYCHQPKKPSLDNPNCGIRVLALDPKKVALARKLYADGGTLVQEICATRRFGRSTLYRYVWE